MCVHLLLTVGLRRSIFIVRRSNLRRQQRWWYVESCYVVVTLSLVCILCTHRNFVMRIMSSVRGCLHWKRFDILTHTLPNLAILPPLHHITHLFIPPSLSLHHITHLNLSLHQITHLNLSLHNITHQNLSLHHITHLSAQVSVDVYCDLFLCRSVFLWQTN